MRNNWIKAYYITLGTFIVFLLVCYSFSLLSIRVDTVSISLLIILTSLPVLFILKKLKVSGVEAEIRDEEIKTLAAQVEKTVSEVNKHFKSTEIRKSISGSYNHLRDQFLLLLDQDNDITVATMIRAVLYEVVERMYQSTYDGPVMMTPINLMINRLIEVKRIPKSLADDLTSTLRISNEIVHGARLSKGSSKTFIETATSVIGMMNNLS